MKHIFQQGKDENAPVLLLLHGTGGTEHDLLALGEIVSPNSSILSVRGNVLENGMPRFFRRLAEGVFDEEDLIFRTEELKLFIEEAATKYNLNKDNIVAIGYSNGANIAASLLFHYENVLKGAILHHPMVPRRGIEVPKQATKVFIAAGANDPICSPQESEELTELLTIAGADVEIIWEHFGHQLTRSEVDKAASWFQKNFS